MLYIKVSPNRVFFINEYSIWIPLMIVIDIAIIVKVKKNRAKKKLELEQFKKKCEQWKIFHTATGNNIAALQVRAGENVLVDLVEDYIQVRHPNCLVSKCIRYVNNERLRKIASSLFKSKAKNGSMSFSRNLRFRLTGFANSSPGFYWYLRLVSVSKKNYLSVGFRNTIAHVNFSPRTYVYYYQPSGRGL
jgi:hypothetical protein